MIERDGKAAKFHLRNFPSYNQKLAVNENFLSSGRNVTDVTSDIQRINEVNNRINRLIND